MSQLLPCEPLNAAMSRLTKEARIDTMKEPMLEALSDARTDALTDTMPDTTRESMPDASNALAETAASRATEAASDASTPPDTQAGPAAQVRRKIRRRAFVSVARRGHRGERGFTLIEVLGALVVGSVIFGFATFAITGALESARVSSFNETLALLRMNIQEVYASSRGFGSTTTTASDITSVLADAGAVPRNWEGDDTTRILHNFGGAVTVSGTLSGFTITAAGVPENACRKIAAAQYECWETLSVNSTAINTAPVTACTADSDGAGTNTLTFLAH